jgi:membrane-associated phospholipid phosphatase
MNRRYVPSTAAALGLVLTLAAPAALAQDVPTDAFGGNPGARFATPQSLHTPAEALGDNPRARLLRWHEISMAATALDHTPAPPGDPRVFREQLGPHRSARALAIVHIAMFDAVNAITGNRFHSYTGLPAVTQPTNLNVAIAVSAYLTTASMWPAQRPEFDALIQEDLNEFPNDAAKLRGITVGSLAAAAILARRHNDGSAHEEPVLGEDYFPGDGPGEWRQDPISQIPLALGARWSEVRPFVMDSASQFRSVPPPALTSAAYTVAYNEVKRLGGDGVTTPTDRTPQQTIAGIYWGYDGTPNLSAPPRLYNQITITIANLKGTGTGDVTNLARLLALVNTAMADAGLACWETKYFYKFWRPIGGIREGNTDDNPNTAVDAGYSPLGAPASNINPGVNFTPPFPAYPSGHATFGAALFQVLRRFYGTSAIPFTFVSDEFNGETTDNLGNVRPRIPRSFPNLTVAEEENGQSRIYLGIHWAFDKTAGILQGRRVADLVWARAFRPR